MLKLLEILFFRKRLIGYLSNNAFPKPLSQEEENICFRKMKNGDKEACNKLIEHNLRLVCHVAKKFESSGVEKDDLISIGTIGLIKGIKSFDNEKSNRFATYGARCIENEILMYLRSLRNSRGDISLNEPVGWDKEGNEITLVEMLSASDEDILDKVELENQKEILVKLLDTLSQRERQVIILRYGLMGQNAYTQREIGQILDISRSYVSRIEKKAVGKLMKKLRE